jgi:hypothetical protein
MTRIAKAPDERRSELIATAQQLFYTKGYERTSVSDIVQSAEIVFAIGKTLNETLVELLLNSDKYDNPTTLARRKIMATQTAIERVLGATPGSLPIDEHALAAWFED